MPPSGVPTCHQLGWYHPWHGTIRGMVLFSSCQHTLLLPFAPSPTHRAPARVHAPRSWNAPPTSQMPPPQVAILQGQATRQEEAMQAAQRQQESLEEALKDAQQAPMHS